MIVGVLLSFVAGLVLGALGGGGSILMVPILAYAVGLGAKEAIAGSLAVVLVTSIAALATHARGGRVAWRTGALFGAGGMAGAFGAGRLSGELPSSVLIVVLALAMLGAASAMIRARVAAEPTVAAPDPRPLRAMAYGLSVGVITGLVGAGGGFVVVPTLVLVAGMSMSRAVGTSLLVIVMQSAAGLAAHLGSAHLTLEVTGPVALAAAIGSVVGSVVTARLPQQTLRRAFGWLVGAVGIFLFGREISTAAREIATIDLRVGLMLAAALVAVSAVAAWLVVLGLRARRAAEPARAAPP